jgi:hypothetical protein
VLDPPQREVDGVREVILLELLGTQDVDDLCPAFIRSGDSAR